MKKRYLLFILLLMLLLSVMVACKNGKSLDSNNTTKDVSVEELPIIAMEEVALNDGNEGRNAYIVVDGIVYDVTSSTKWKSGTHNGFQAGKDLSEEILRDSPHGTKVLKNIKAIGRIEK